MLIYLTFSGLFLYRELRQSAVVLGIFESDLSLGDSQNFTSYRESKIWEAHSKPGNHIQSPGRHSVPFPLPACFAPLPYFWKLPSLDPTVATLGAPFFSSSHLDCDHIPVLSGKLSLLGFPSCLGPSKPRNTQGNGSLNTWPPPVPPGLLSLPPSLLPRCHLPSPSRQMLLLSLSPKPFHLRPLESPNLQ